MTHNPEEQERPFVTWSKGKEDSDRIVMAICRVLVPIAIAAFVYHLF